MIPTHKCSLDYSEYEHAYINNAGFISYGDDTEECLRNMCCSLFHYSFHILPDQTEGKVYTPASVAFQVPKFFAKSVSNILTNIAIIGISPTITKDMLIPILKEPLFKEIAEQLGWMADLVYRAFLSYFDGRARFSGLSLEEYQKEFEELEI